MAKRRRTKAVAAPIKQVKQKSVELEVTLTDELVRFRFDPDQVNEAQLEELKYKCRLLHNMYLFGHTNLTCKKGEITIRAEGMRTRGIPVRITPKQAKALQADQDRLFKKSPSKWMDERVDVFDPHGDNKELYILSNSGSPRILCNVRGRYLAARGLGCEYVVNRGKAYWQGKTSVHVEDE